MEVNDQFHMPVVKVVEASCRRLNGLDGEEINTLQESGIESWLFNATLLTGVPAHLCNVINIHENGDVLFHLPGVEAW